VQFGRRHVCLVGLLNFETPKGVAARPHFESKGAPWATTASIA